MSWSNPSVILYTSARAAALELIRAGDILRELAAAGRPVLDADMSHYRDAVAGFDLLARRRGPARHGWRRR